MLDNSSVFIFIKGLVNLKLNDEELFELCKTYSESVDPYVVFAVTKIESSGNPEADSGYARGLMQMSKIALKDVNNNYGTNYEYNDLFKPEINLIAGSRYLSMLSSRLYKGDHLFHMQFVLLAYAWGIGNVKKWLYETEPDNTVIDETIPADKKDYLYNIMYWYSYAKRKFAKK